MRTNIPVYTGEAGTYLLEIKGGPVTERRLLQVADITLARNRSNDGERLWLTQRDGFPLAGYAIHGAYTQNVNVRTPYQTEEPVDPETQNSGSHTVTRMREETRLVEYPFKGCTDDNGLLTFPSPPHDIASFWAVVEMGSGVFLINEAGPAVSIDLPAPWEPVPEAAPIDRKSTRLNSSHSAKSRMPSSA